MSLPTLCKIEHGTPARIKEIEQLLQRALKIKIIKYRVELDAEKWKELMSKVAQVINRDEKEIVELQQKNLLLTQANADLTQQLQAAQAGGLDADDQAALKTAADRQAAEDAASAMQAEGGSAAAPANA